MPPTQVLVATTLDTDHGADGDASAPATLTAVWASNPFDKVHDADLRRSGAPSQRSGQPWRNAWYDPATETVHATAARGEYAALASVYLENAGGAGVTGLSVTMTPLAGTGSATGAALAYAPADLTTGSPGPVEKGRRLVSWTGRDVELFYVRHAQVRCLSRFAVDDWHGGKTPNSAPSRFSTPRVGSNPAIRPWRNRPDAEQWYPSFCVPIELHPTFTVPAARLREVYVAAWVDASRPAGVYVGTLTVRQGATIVRTLTIRLTVSARVLPAVPTTRGIVMLSQYMVNFRATRQLWPADGTPQQALGVAMAEHGCRVLRRGGVTMWLDYAGYPPDNLQPLPRRLLTGATFATATGFRGRGQGQGTGWIADAHWHAFAGVPQFGPWNTAAARAKIAAWADTFYRHVQSLSAQGGVPNPTVHQYVVDEPDFGGRPNLYADIEAAARAVVTSAGPGRRIRPWVTLAARARYAADFPSVRTLAFGATYAPPGAGDVGAAVTKHKARGGDVVVYNGGRPGSGAFHLEMPCGDMLMKAWHAARHGADLFNYEGTYWTDNQNGGYNPEAVSPIWTEGANFDRSQGWMDDPEVGRVRRAQNAGWCSTSNYDGMMLGPGTDAWDATNNYDVGTCFLRRDAFAFFRALADADHIAQARAVDAEATAAVVNAVLPGAVGWDIPSINNGTGNDGYTTAAPVWPEGYAAYEQARTRLAAIVAGVAPSGLPVVTASLVRHDGQTGTALARGPLPFAPGAVQPADLAKLSAWSGATEVPLYVADVGARHTTAGADAAGPDNGVLYAHVELEGTWSDGNTHPSVTFRFDRPVRAARRARAAYAAVTNTLAVAVSRAMPSRLALTNSGFWHHHADDRVRRWAPLASVPWHVPSGFRTRVQASPDRVTGFPVLLVGRSDGTVVAICAIRDREPSLWRGPVRTLDAAAGAPATGVDGQLLAIGAVWLKAGTGTFTPGVTALTDPMVEAVNVTGGAAALFPMVPSHLPVATVTPTDPAYLCASRLVPWAIEPAAATRARGGTDATVVGMSLAAADTLYRTAAVYAWTFTNSGRTTYAPSLKQWQDFARTGELRRLRRALSAWRPWRDHAIGSGTWNGQSGFEGFCDTSMCVVHEMLTGDPEAAAGAEPMLREEERQQLGRGRAAAAADVTHRRGMHVMQGLVLHHRRGWRSAAGYHLAGRPPSDASPQLSEPAVGTVARWQRLVRHWTYWMTPAPAPNAGMQAISQPAYGLFFGRRDHPALAPFLGPGLLLGWGAECQRHIATVPAFDRALVQTWTYLHDARRAAWEPAGSLYRYFGLPGQEGYYYSTAHAYQQAHDAAPGTELNGTYFLSLARLVTVDAAAAPKWRRLGDTLYTALQSGTPDAFGRNDSEFGLFTATWPLARDG